MARINEIKQQQVVVATVGNFADSLQQIAAMRMVKLRKLVLSSRRFVEEATIILRDLHLEKSKNLAKEMKSNKKSKKKLKSDQDTNEVSLANLRTAIIIVSSDIGLCGSYNTEIIVKLADIMDKYSDADFFVIGHKGQNYMSRFAPKKGISYYPYNIPEEVGIEDLKPLIGMFYYYNQIYLVYNKYINTTTRKVDFIELAVPNLTDVEAEKEATEGKFIFEPNIDDLIATISARVRYALFRQQILDSKLALYTAQMIAMKTAADNADNLMSDLKMEYNKARRKIIDKKIQEVQAGRALWDN
jgi:F-type H+-transporting ATPase subunit gamma